MTLKTGSIVLGALVGLGVLAGAMAQDGARPATARPKSGGALKASAPARALKIGVVDLKQCFDREKYDRIGNAEREYKAYYTTLQDKLDAVKLKVKHKQEELPLAEGKKNLRQNILTELYMLNYELEMTAKMNEHQALARYQQIQMDIYNGIREVVDDYGKENGFDLILKTDEPQLAENSIESVSKRINHRPVLYSNPDLDITKQILDRLQAVYRRDKRNN